jgi:hypothetical protein
MITVGLQEWAVSCAALASGQTVALVRKGGIHEPRGGLFQVEHRRFALLPTYLHQDPSRLAAGVRERTAATQFVDPRPGWIGLDVVAEIVEAWKVTDRDSLGELGGESIWSADELARRFQYRDQPWLYVLALRVSALSAARWIPDEPSYAGCRSWVALREAIGDEDAKPVIADAAFADRLAALRRAVAPA